MDEPLVFSAAFEAGERLRSFIKLLLIKDSISFFLAGAAGLGLDFLSVDAIMSGLCSGKAYRVSNNKNENAFLAFSSSIASNLSISYLLQLKFPLFGNLFLLIFLEISKFKENRKV